MKRPQALLRSARPRLGELRSGDLLRQATERFDDLVTVDMSMGFQGSLRGMRPRVAVLDAKGNDLTQLVAAAQALLPRLEDPGKGYARTNHRRPPRDA